VSTIPAPITVYHKVWTQTDENDSHGNPIIRLADPVPRRVQSIAQADSHEIISPQAAYLSRTETLLNMAVPNPSLYQPKDQVIIGATGLDNNRNPVGGVAFHVEEIPSDNRLGPLPLLNRMVGGVVQIRRVT
jgi:hypothetical protein